MKLQVISLVGFLVFLVLSLVSPDYLWMGFTLFFFALYWYEVGRHEGAAAERRKRS